MIFSPGLYIHIPWCHTRCIYCDFNTYVEEDSSLKARYQAALTREIEESAAALGRPRLATLYFGGGTPTTLPAAWLVELVETVQAAFDLPAGAEITVEANPGTVTVDYLRELRRGGVNRLSLGVQSFRDAELRFLSRLHSADEARQAVSAARAAGFDNLSLDLIFNLPGQSLPEWAETLDEAIRLAPEHLSLYSLIVEPGTPLHRLVGIGLVPAPDDDLAADMYALAVDRLGEAGYTQYEISNWARSSGEGETEAPRLAAAHNLIYWRNQPYLGLGAGAVSTVDGRRWMNVKRPKQYAAQVEAGTGLALAADERAVEQIDRPTAMTEHLMLGLRLTREGVAAAEFAARFGTPLTDAFPQAIELGIGRGLLEWVPAEDGPHLRLTPQGRFLANQAMVEFVGG
ncbi:MAG: radical SAM family heme chaperone HemW, partial [Chloroflexi bacterium]